MSERRFTVEMANKICASIQEFEELFSPGMIESIEVVGGIKNRGFSDHDIDILLKLELEPDSKLINNTLNQLKSWLQKQHGDVTNFLHFIIYVKVDWPDNPLWKF